MNFAKRFIFAALMIGMTLSVACNDDDQIKTPGPTKTPPTNKVPDKDPPKPKPYKAKDGYACGRQTPCAEGLKCFSVNGSPDVGECRPAKECDESSPCGEGTSCLPQLLIGEGPTGAPVQPQAGGSLDYYPGTHWDMLCGTCNKYTKCGENQVCVRLINNFSEGTCRPNCANNTDCNENASCVRLDLFDVLAIGTKGSGSVCLTGVEQKVKIGKGCTSNEECGGVDGVACITNDLKGNNGTCRRTCKNKGYAVQECGGSGADYDYCIPQFKIVDATNANVEVNACAPWENVKDKIMDLYAECDMVSKFCGNRMVCVKKKIEDSTGYCTITSCADKTVCDGGECAVIDSNLVMQGYTLAATEKVCQK